MERQKRSRSCPRSKGEPRARLRLLQRGDASLPFPMNPTPSDLVLWGRKATDPDWAETILSTNPNRFDEIKLLAARDGFTSFRVVTLGGLPDFAKMVRKSRK